MMIDVEAQLVRLAARARKAGVDREFVNRINRAIAWFDELSGDDPLVQRFYKQAVELGLMRTFIKNGRMEYTVTEVGDIYFDIHDIDGHDIDIFILLN